jgi:hypothetical protein
VRKAEEERVYIAEADPGELRIGAGTPYGHLDENPITEFRVEDRASGQTIVTFGVTQSQLTALIRGTMLRPATEWTCPPGRLRDRIGKTMATRSVDIPVEVARFSKDHKAAQAWADLRAKPGEEVDIQLHNYGWSARFRSWAEASSDV